MGFSGNQTRDNKSSYACTLPVNIPLVKEATQMISMSKGEEVCSVTMNHIMGVVGHCYFENIHWKQKFNQVEYNTNISAMEKK